MLLWGVLPAEPLIQSRLQSRWLAGSAGGMLLVCPVLAPAIIL